ncbi:MAG: hypothetical protein CL493_04515 [Actinobacteria bacterium]|nr:hypothetical protein [Actinomycetota bacterium]
MNPSKIDIDRNISKLRVNSSEFLNLDKTNLISMLEQVINNIQTISYYWASLSSEKKGHLTKSKEGEEWIGGPFSCIYALQYFIEYLQDEDGLDINNFDETNKSYKVFPTKNIEKLLFPFLEGEIRFGKNLNFDQINEYRGFANRFNSNKPKITLVLGAGNVSSIPVLDALFHMIAHKSVIYIKLNPVNDYLLPIFTQIFEPFISRGFMIITEGDMEASKYLTEHDGFQHTHLTGSNYTYESIVYGKTLSDKERSLKSLPKINKKPITTELGNVTPIIVHPGNWSRTEIRHQAKKIVTAKLNNSGFNCIAAQVIVLPKDWKHTAKLKADIKNYLKKIGDTTSYYPGAIENLNDLNNSNNYEQINNLSCSTPFLISNLDLEHEYGNKEVWSTALYFKEISYNSYEDFCTNSVNYVNNELWGNLGVSVLIKNYKKKKNEIILNSYVENLKYGTVAINEWSALGFVIPSLPWGGYPGNKDNDIQSGQGYVHNSFLFESPQKGIIYSKFRLSRLIDPPWFVTNKKAHRIFKNLTYYQASNSKINLIKLIFSTLI